MVSQPLLEVDGMVPARFGSLPKTPQAFAWLPSTSPCDVSARGLRAASGPSGSPTAPRSSKRAALSVFQAAGRQGEVVDTKHTVVLPPHIVDPISMDASHTC